MYSIETHKLVFPKGYMKMEVQKLDGTPVGEPFPLTDEDKTVHIEIVNSAYVITTPPRPDSIQLAFQLDKIEEFTVTGTKLKGIGSIDLRDIGRIYNPKDFVEQVTMEFDLACTGHTIWNQGGGFGLKLYFVDLGCHQVVHS